MKTSESIAKVSKSLCGLQSELEHVAKDKSGYGYKYADLASCLDTLKPLLKKYELAVTQIMTRDDNVPVLETILLHSSGEYISGSFPLVAVSGMGKANNVQQMGAALTYFRRYALSAITGLAAEDDDAASVGNDIQRPQYQKKQASPKKYTAQDCIDQIHQMTNLKRLGDCWEWVKKQGYHGNETVVAAYHEIKGRIENV